MIVHRKAFIFLLIIAQVILPTRWAPNVGWYEPILFEFMAFAWALMTSMVIQLVDNYKARTELDTTI